jgi:NADH-quinone oxidoreductase subunit A
MCCEATPMSGPDLLLEYLSKFFPILLFIFIGLAFGVVTLVVSYFLQPRYPEPEKLSAYECGSEPFSDARMPFPVRYYIFAMLFVIFDIEVIFLYPWAVAFSKIGVIGLIEMLIFIALFLVAYVYAWKKGALEWD